MVFCWKKIQRTRDVDAPTVYNRRTKIVQRCTLINLLMNRIGTYRQRYNKFFTNLSNLGNEFIGTFSLLYTKVPVSCWKWIFFRRNSSATFFKSRCGTEVTKWMVWSPRWENIYLSLVESSNLSPFFNQCIEALRWVFYARRRRAF